MNQPYIYFAACHFKLYAFFLQPNYLVQGYHGDTSATSFCGDVDDEAKKLVEVVFWLISIKFNLCCHVCAFLDIINW